MEDQPNQNRTGIFWSRYRNALAAPLLCHASAGGPLRYTHGAGAPGTCGCLHGHDLYACSEQARNLGKEPG